MADELLIKDLRAQIERGQVIAIVGAGVSMGATNENPLATWTGLLEDGVARCWEIAQPLPDDWRERVLAEIRSREGQPDRPGDRQCGNAVGSGHAARRGAFWPSRRHFHFALVTSVRGLQRPFGVAWRESIQPSSLSREAARDTFLSIGGQKFENDPHLDALLTALDYVPLAVTVMAYAAEGEPDLASVWKRWQRERTRMLQRAHGNERLTNIEVSYETSISGNRMTENARRLLKLFAYLPNGVTPEELDRIFPIDCDEAPGVLRKAGLAFDEPGRCRVLAPLREYVREKHPPDPDDLKRLIDFYLERAIAEGSKVGFSGGSDAILRIAPQLANLEGAILQGLQSDHSEKAIKAALALATFARLTRLGSSQALEKAASKAQTLGESQTAADCIRSLAGIALARSQHEAARTRFEEALLLYRQVGDVLGEANCIRSLGDIALRRSQQEAARARFEEALPLFRQVGFVLGEANCIHRLGDNALQRSQHDAARARFEHALPLFREVGSVLGEANCILSLGVSALRRSQHDAARARFEQALPLYRQVGSVLGEANCIQRLGDIALRRSQHDDARTRFEEALQLFVLISEPFSIGTTHHRLARLASDTDERKSHVIAAIAAWEQIKRDDLIAAIKSEFADIP
jgi:tetratricopeptide (TPR) repeat protein